jgi:hypothetical protein
MYPQCKFRAVKAAVRYYALQLDPIQCERTKKCLEILKFSMGDKTANFKFPPMTKGGVRLEVLLNATTQRDEQGNIIGVVGIGQDITGRIA